VDYTNLIRDFAERTLHNLDYVQEQAGHDDVDAHEPRVYPVTQLCNSLLGLIVLPHERDVARIPSTPMVELWSKGWPRLRTTKGSERTTLNGLVRALRNAVAHFNVEFNAESGGEITSVTMWNQDFDKDRRPIPNSRRWEVDIELEELEDLARRIAELYVTKFRSSAA
jgi:hypothetical protein